MRYAEVILPLSVQGTYTYSIDESMEKEVEVGSRVLVQFGKKKHYTAIITALHSQAPSGYDVKPIIAPLDPVPIVRHPQIKLWNWIADYYLCTLGEVYKAAVPTGLKPESETYVMVNPDFEPAPEYHPDEREQMILQALADGKRHKVADIEQSTGLRNLTGRLGKMLDAGSIIIGENIVERYKPKKVTMVRLQCERNDDEKLHEFFNKVNRSANQERALIAYLDLSRWLVTDEEPRSVSREELQEKAHVSPATIKAMESKGIFNIHAETINRFKSSQKSTESILSPLSEAQGNALVSIKEDFKTHNVCLLHGVTGSGKTEIYTHLAEETLHKGEQVLYLVPEISLTTQLTDRLKRVFGERLLVYHSKFSDNERVDIWRRLLGSREPLVVIGARSALFLPFSRLGLVIVDEEHESSYKQYDPAPRYNARDAAIMLASMHGAHTLLGSATPSIETYWKAKGGKFGLVKLTERFSGAHLPEVNIVDMKEMRSKKLTDGILSAPLARKTTEALAGGGQAIMFQNRRGFAPVVVCDTCGWTPKCVNCDVSLVYHKHTDMLRCHYCGYATPLPKLCPACGENTLKVFGYGTERIAEELHRRFENYRVSRMDLDTTRNKDAHQEIIEEFARHDTDILVGTQMVTKGLDFENVRIVGVLNADTLLNFPDFRSNERAFNMLEQVAGRAGRRKEKGEVVIQTTQPDNHVLSYVRRHDYEGFYEEEIADRARYGYPPFTKVINIYIKHRDARQAEDAAVAYAKALVKVFGNRVLGPEKPYVSRVATYHLQTIMLKVESGASMKRVKEILRAIYVTVATLPSVKGSSIYFDVDPA
ncbi:MAG: primosomal protein N' [Bacteroidales bacterium]|nr:primosomal protein N' [Bacteroidales bacterium]